jgi:hypothetical protein
MEVKIMCWVLLVVFIVLFVLLILVSDEDFFLISVFPGAGVVITIIAILMLLSTLINGRVIDQKIDMYTQENAAIEESIDGLVKNYMDYESDTFGELKGDSSITLVSLYPELKADELVKAQIETYQANNDKIKSLKEEKLNLSSVKWWLYFGK